MSVKGYPGHGLVADDAAKPVGVLLLGSDEAAAERLRGREIGSSLEYHVQRSTDAARELDAAAPDYVHRVHTDRRPVRSIAEQIVSILGWSP